MISQEKWMILTSLQKLPNNLGDLGKIIIATGFERLPKVQIIAQTGHTAANFSTDLRSEFKSCLSLFVCWLQKTKINKRGRYWPIYLALPLSVKLNFHFIAKVFKRLESLKQFAPKLEKNH